MSATIDRSGWKRVTLGEVCEISKGEQLNRATLAEKGRIPVYNGGSAPSGYAEQANTDAENVIISEGGNSCGYVNYIHVPFWRGGHCYLLETKLDKLLLYYILKANESKIMSLRVGTGLPNIQRERLNAFEFLLPIDTIKQRQIVSTFVSIDTHVTALDALIAKYEAIKKATVNLLLTPKSGWERVKLGDVAVTSSGGTPNRSNEGYYQGTIPWFTTSELHDEVLYDSKEHISEEALQKTTAKVFPAGTLLLAMYGATIGKLGVLAKPAATNQACCAIKCGSNVETAFLFQVLINRRQELVALGCGAGQPNISQQIVQNLSLVLPPLSEQRKIAEQIAAIDNVLADYKAQLEKARQLKVGMMTYFFG